MLNSEARSLQHKTGVMLQRSWVSALRYLFPYLLLILSLTLYYLVLNHSLTRVQPRFLILQSGLVYLLSHD